MQRVLILTLLGACTGGGTEPTVDAVNACMNETRADTFVVGIDKKGAAGNLDFQLMSGDPAPPARGDNTWVIQLSSMNAGVVGGPIAGADLVVTPFMPDHGHGTPIKVNVTPAATSGQYQLSPINMWMPGYWETTVQATDGATTDSAVFKFCIPY